MTSVLAKSMLIAVVLVFTASTAAIAEEQLPKINIKVEKQVLRNVQAPVELTKEQIDEKYFDLKCEVKAVSKNNSSVHPGNDITVSSNGTNVVLEDVERKDGVLTEANGKLTMGEDVTVSLTKVGESKTYSGGFEVHITCPNKVEPQEPETPEVPETPETPEVEPEQPGKGETTPQPETLPNTGAGALITLFSASTILGTVAHALYRNRK